ncbi:MAG: single-stranded DNA-binding protein [Candidatus Niyogibacteria bacterium]|nr:MAG: single-stranded DNA-binding protein [Candidatus Niyogibacteria bacterium]
MNLNKIFIIGNLTRDPETRSLPSGQNVTSFGVATNRFFNKDGQKQQDTQFHNVVAFGRLADVAKQYLNKGSLIMVEGRIQNRSWQGQDGQKKYRTEIVTERMQLGPRNSGSSASRPEKAKEESQPEVDTIEYGEENINPDDIPF